MRIVHVYKDYHPPVRGGIEQTLERMARAQARDGHEVTVLVSTHGGRRTIRERLEGVSVVRCAEWARALSSPICPGLMSEISRLKADVWHLHYPDPLGELAWLMVSPPGGVVVSYYADIVRQRWLLPFYGPIVNRLLARAQIVHAISPQALERSDSLLAPFRARCRVVPLGIEIDPLLALNRSSPAYEAVRQRYGGPFILFVGRLRQYKGLSVLLEAMRQITLPLVIIGEGPMRASLLAQACAAGLEHRVHFVGSVDDDGLRDHLGAASIGVLPSIHPSEAYGLAMIEYLAAGIPAVCTDVATGTTFVNQAGETGLVVPPGDAATLAAAIMRLVADPLTRERMGAAGRARAQALFTTEAMMRGLDGIYAEVRAAAPLVR